MQTSTLANGILPTLSRSTAKPTLVCFSHLRWDFVFQRPQHLLTRAASDYRVIYVEEPIIEPVCGAHLARRQVENGVTVAVPVLPDGTTNENAVAMQRDLIDALLLELSPDRLAFWYYTPMALGFTDPSQADVVVYDNMDELSAFRGAPPALLDNETKLMTAADHVFIGGISLFEAKYGRHPSIHAFPSSIDAQHFSAARGEASDPADQGSIEHPRIGFFGVLDERLDLDLVRDIAAQMPDHQFVMIGPVVKIDPAGLPQAPNIHWLGPKSYVDLPHYLGGWDAGFMPFALNESTRFISPTKTPEFLAAGLPLVSTPIADVVRPYGTEGHVEIAASAEDMAETLARLLVRPREAWLQAVDKRLATMSWDRVYAEMNQLIASVPTVRQDIIRTVRTERSSKAVRRPALAVG